MATDTNLLADSCGGCTAYDQHGAGYGYCIVTGTKTVPGHLCDAPSQSIGQPLGTFELRRYAANEASA